jgi:hypothetical protein
MFRLIDWFLDWLDRGYARELAHSRVRLSRQWWSNENIFWEGENGDDSES